MPRPGPRPYECVRRAWHSDRHKSMRGSIIQQIFKVVCEHHSSVTKKNKEWQEKLPVVVLKAEEIMYSKANSESEYMDLGTLWDRVNDAIDTIIRKDENAETGGLLPPCVEAALNLGCVPVRASRSQRHSNPRTYLSPKTVEPVSSTSKAPIVVPRNNDPKNPSLWSPTPVPDINLPPTPVLPMKSYSSVYPLYYGTNFQNKMYQPEFQTPQNPSDIIVGTPVYASSLQRPSEMISARLMCPNEAVDEISPNRTNHGGPECDLSLRLGLVSESDSFYRAKSSSFSKGDKVEDVVSPSFRSNELCLFSAEYGNDSSKSQLVRFDLDGEGPSEQISSRKRKNMGKEQSLWR